MSHSRYFFTPCVCIVTFWHNEIACMNEVSTHIHDTGRPIQYIHTTLALKEVIVSCFALPQYFPSSSGPVAFHFSATGFQRVAWAHPSNPNGVNSTMKDGERKNCDLVRQTFPLPNCLLRSLLSLPSLELFPSYISAVFPLCHLLSRPSGYSKT